MKTRLIALLAVLQGLMDTYQIPTGGQTEITYKTALAELEEIVTAPDDEQPPPAAPAPAIPAPQVVDLSPLVARLVSIETALISLLPKEAPAP